MLTLILIYETVFHVFLVLSLALYVCDCFYSRYRFLSLSNFCMYTFLCKKKQILKFVTAKYKCSQKMMVASGSFFFNSSFFQLRNRK